MVRISPHRLHCLFMGIRWECKADIFSIRENLVIQIFEGGKYTLCRKLKRAFNLGSFFESFCLLLFFLANPHVFQKKLKWLFSVLLLASHGCKAVNDCKVAINCHPDKITYAPTQSSCESRGCLWLGAAAGQTRPRCVFYNNSILGKFDPNQLFAGGNLLIIRWLDLELN